MIHHQVVDGVVGVVVVDVVVVVVDVVVGVASRDEELIIVSSSSGRQISGRSTELIIANCKQVKKAQIAAPIGASMVLNLLHCSYSGLFSTQVSIVSLLEPVFNPRKIAKAYFFIIIFFSFSLDLIRMAGSVGEAWD